MVQGAGPRGQLAPTTRRATPERRPSLEPIVLFVVGITALLVDPGCVRLGYSLANEAPGETGYSAEGGQPEESGHSATQDGGHSDSRAETDRDASRVDSTGDTGDEDLNDGGLAYTDSSSAEISADADEPTDASPLIVQTTSLAVAHRNDDAEELLVDGWDIPYYRGWVYLDSSDLELINDDWLSDQIVGLRFAPLEVPRGATIIEAFLQFTVDEHNDGPTSLRISGQAAADAPAFSSTDFDISSRPKTSAVVPWNSLPSWTAEEIHNTPNLADVVQEIINRAGWAHGNSIVFLVEGSGERSAYAFDGKREKAPRLHVSYGLPASTP